MKCMSNPFENLDTEHYDHSVQLWYTGTGSWKVGACNVEFVYQHIICSKNEKNYKNPGHVDRWKEILNE